MTRSRDPPLPMGTFKIKGNDNGKSEPGTPRQLIERCTQILADYFSNHGDQEIDRIELTGGSRREAFLANSNHYTEVSEMVIVRFNELTTESSFYTITVFPRERRED